MDKVFKKQLMIPENSNFELTEKRGRLQYRYTFEPYIHFTQAASIYKEVDPRYG